MPSLRYISNLHPQLQAQRHRQRLREERKMMITYRLATLALISGWELPEMSLISFAIWSNIVKEGKRKERGEEFLAARNK